MSALPPIADMCGAVAHIGFGPIADIRPKFLSAYKLKEGRQSKRPDLFFCFSLFYSFLCRINTCGNLLPAITVPDITAADRQRSLHEAFVKAKARRSRFVCVSAQLSEGTPATPSKD